MTRRLIRYGIPALIGVLVVGVALLARYRAFTQTEGLAITLEWARLAPLPNSARDLTVVVEGSMFTRAFRTRFTASVEELQQWITNSPGPSSTTPQRSGASILYMIEPGGGAQHAEMTVDLATGEVRIYVYWS